MIWHTIGKSFYCISLILLCRYICPPIQYFCIASQVVILSPFVVSVWIGHERFSFVYCLPIFIDNYGKLLLYCYCEVFLGSFWIALFISCHRIACLWNHTNRFLLSFDKRHLFFYTTEALTLVEDNNSCCCQIFLNMLCLTICQSIRPLQFSWIDF